MYRRESARLTFWARGALIGLCVLCAAVARPAHAQTPPAVLTATSTNLTDTTALLTASFTPNSPAGVAGWFSWGLTTNFGNRTATQHFPGGTNTVFVVASISGLTPTQTYYFRFGASNEFGVGRSPTLSFVTEPVRFYDLSASNITAAGALITSTFSANSPGLTWFRYGFSSNVGYATPVESFTATSNLLTRSQQLTNLTPNRTYYYRLMASNEFGVRGSYFASFATRLNFSIEYVNDVTPEKWTG